MSERRFDNIHGTPVCTECWHARGPEYPMKREASCWQRECYCPFEHRLEEDLHDDRS